MIIKIDDITCKQVLGLLQEHYQDMRLHSPPESIHALDVSSLQANDVTFWTAWIDNELAGCGALKQLTTSHGEIKSMRTSNAFRRQGVAASLLKYIINESNNRGYEQLSLEKGSMDAFNPARKMYESFGFSYCSPFADYIEDIHSVFMTLEL